nr:hypothetical protein [Morchella crassipes]
MHLSSVEDRRGRCRLPPPLFPPLPPPLASPPIQIIGKGGMKGGNGGGRGHRLHLPPPLRGGTLSAAGGEGPHGPLWDFWKACTFDLPITVPRNEADSDTLVIKVWLRVIFNSESKKVLTFSSRYLQSSLEPLTPMSQSSAYLTYTSLR